MYGLPYLDDGLSFFQLSTFTHLDPAHVLAVTCQFSRFKPQISNSISLPSRSDISQYSTWQVPRHMQYAMAEPCSRL